MWVEVGCRAPGKETLAEGGLPSSFVPGGQESARVLGCQIRQKDAERKPA